MSTSNKKSDSAFFKGFAAATVLMISGNFAGEKMLESNTMGAIASGGYSDIQLIDDKVSKKDCGMGILMVNRSKFIATDEQGDSVVAVMCKKSSGEPKISIKKTFGN